MQRENLAECQPGDWVAMMDAEEHQPGEETNLQAWRAPNGTDWLFQLKEIEIEGGTVFGWVRE